MMDDIARCSARVSTPGLRMHFHPCQRKFSVIRDGKPYCKQHDPEAVMARRAESNARYEEEQQRWLRKREIEVANTEIVRAARGYFRQEVSLGQLADVVAKREALGD